MSRERAGLDASGGRPGDRGPSDAARRSRYAGRRDTPEHFAARLAAAPVDGAANAALMALVAKTFGVPKRDVTIDRGRDRAAETRCTSPATPQALAEIAAALYAAGAMSATIIDGKAAAAGFADPGRDGGRRLLAATRPRAGAGGGAGRRGSGVRGLCPLEGQGDARGRDGRASSTACPPTSTQDDAARAGRPAQRRSGGRRHPRPAAAAARRSTSDAVIARDRPDKDVDGFHPVNAGRLATGLPGFVPCTPLGCLMLLKDRSVPIWPGSRRWCRAVEHRRQADGAVAARAKAAPSRSRTAARATCPRVIRRADIVVAAVGIARI